MAELQTSTCSETASSNTATPPDGYPEGMSRASVNNSMRELLAITKREWNRSHPTLTNGGSSTVLTLTYTTAPTAYAQGLMFAFKALGAIGAVPTINVNALGAKTIWKNVAGTATQIAANDWYTGQIIVLSYDTALDAAAGGFNWVNQLTPVGGTITIAAAGAGVTLVSTDAGAAEGPTLDLYRNSATPAANDLTGAINFQGEDSAGNTEVYGKIVATIIDPTSTSENATITVQTVEAGTLAARLVVGGAGGGTQIGAPTGGDKGAGTLNVAGGLYINGTLAVATQAQAETAAATDTFLTPGIAKYLPFVPKVALGLSTSGGTPTANSAVNVSSITDNGVGDFTVNFTTAFSAATYCVLFGDEEIAANERSLAQVNLSGRATGSVRLTILNFNQAALIDPVMFGMAILGDQ